MNFTKRLIPLTGVLLATLVLCAGCGGSSAGQYATSSTAAASAAPSPGDYYEYGKTDMEDAMADSAENAEGMGGLSGGEITQTLSSQAGTMTPEQLRKIIKTINLDAQTTDFDMALSKLTQLIEGAGGYIEGQTVNGRSIDPHSGQASEGARFASIQARIPAEKLDEVTDAVGGACNILQKDQSIQDISDSYFDAQARLKTLEIQEERLLDILSKAVKLEEVVTLERSLSEVRYEIETITAGLRRMDSQVRYSYLNINLSEVVRYDKPSELPQTFGQELQIAASRSFERVGHTLGNTLLWWIEYGPTLVINLVGFSLLVYVGLLLARWLLRRFHVQNSFTDKGPLIKRSVFQRKSKRSAMRPEDFMAPHPKKDSDDPPGEE